MAETLVWNALGTGYAAAPRQPVRARSRTVQARRRAAPRGSVPSVSVAASIAGCGVAAPRRSLWRRIAWRRVAGLAGDVLAVAVWAAWIPGLMWLGTAAGF
jgi:hypothetical protein